jgi:enterochelin esterase family protein
MVKHFPKRDVRIWMDAGKLEWLLYSSRKMHRLLKSKSYDVTYHEYTGGHNYTAWRDDLWRGLEALFGMEK